MSAGKAVRHIENDASEYVLRSPYADPAALAIQGVSTLPALFRWQAQRRGASTLFSFREPRGNVTAISYAAAYDKASLLASSLRNCQPTGAPGVIGIWFEKSIELHLAIFAVTFSGAAWLPFDPDAPAARVATCLGDSEASILLCDAAHYVAASDAVSGVDGCRVVTFDDLNSLAQSNGLFTDGFFDPKPSDAAYLIYTSGSTGTPKGIEVPHSAALAFSLGERSVLGTRPDDIVWQGFSPAFDMFIEETWVSIAGGAHLAIGNRVECHSVPTLSGPTGTWATRGVTVINAVPTLMALTIFSPSSLPLSIRVINLGGEACPPELVTRLSRPGVRIFNTYGPSETTVTATVAELHPNTTVTIGKPLPGYHAMLMEPGKLLWPIPVREGAEGELIIGGAGVSNGYIRRAELTAEKFIRHPFGQKEDGERVYRTGDLARVDSDGNLVFLGRIDAQVKHRGFRIEPGEIEGAFVAHPHVQTAAVILSARTNRLEAYVVVDGEEAVSVNELRDATQHLPAYMQPEEIVFLAPTAMPRLPSGKINAAALQELSTQLAIQKEEEESEQRMNSVSTLVSESSSHMAVLLRAMAEVFPQVDNIAPHSDFFDDLGGHSLAAAMLVSFLRKSGPEGSPVRQLGLQEIYVHRTAEKMLATLVDDDDSLTDGSVNEKEKQQDRHTDDPWPVSRIRHFVCGLAQIPALLFFFFLGTVSMLGPYLVFTAVLVTSNVGNAILSTYGFYVVLPPAFALIGLAGKWLVLGRAKPGEYPLYGVYYYRWWLAEHFLSLVGMGVVSETPLLPLVLRCLGMRVGKHCHLAVPLVGPAYDLVSIGDDVVLSRDTVLSTSWVERGRLILAPIRIESGAFVGSQSVLEGNTIIREGGELGVMTMLPAGSVVPPAERWIGSPARFHDRPYDVGNMRASRPGWARVFAMKLATALAVVFVLPILGFAPQIPSILLFQYVQIPGIWPWVAVAVVAAPAAMAYFVMVFLTLLTLRWVVLGRVRERTYRASSVYAYRKWFVERLMDISLAILHPVYASLYVVPFLRALGVRVGRMAEVSTARGIDFELTEIGDESFIADAVLVGDRSVRANTMTLRKTQLAGRAFAGNSALLPQGTHLPSNSLVGVLSVAPETPLKPGQSCFGSPAVLMPARQAPTKQYPDHVLFAPRWTQIAMRLFVEGMRIFLPRMLVVFGLGYGVRTLILVYQSIGVAWTVGLTPLFYLFFFAIPALLITCLAKWILIGRYYRAEWPLWTLNVWKSEFVTTVYETLAAPMLTEVLAGTPFLAWAFRMFGTQIGARTTLLASDITEFDMVSLGDEAVLNRHAHPQTHLFEDRVMKIGRVDIGAGGCMGTYSIGLPGSSIGAKAQLGSLSLLMKGETVPAGEAWEGDPIAPRHRRQPRVV